MEARAKAVGAGGQIKYIFPSNGGVHGDDVAKAKALGLGPQLVSSVHAGPCAALRCTALHCAALRCTALHCAALRCTTVLCCAVLHCGCDCSCVISMLQCATHVYATQPHKYI